MKEEKRKKILSAAEALFSRGRFHEVTMDEVALKAGVGKGTIYRYFKNKDDLFFELALSGHDELCKVVRTEGRRSDDFRQCLLNVCRCVSEFHQRRRRLVQVMQSEERRALWTRGHTKHAWIESRRELIGAVAEILEIGQGQGEIRRDVQLQILASFLLGILRTRGQTRRLDSGVEIDHETVVDLFLNGASAQQ